MQNKGMPLKPQDIMVVLKLCSYERKRPPFLLFDRDSKFGSDVITAGGK